MKKRKEYISPCIDVITICGCTLLAGSTLVYKDEPVDEEFDCLSKEHDEKIIDVWE